jgi:protein TonB
VVRTPIRQNPKSQQPNMDDYYPPTSKRLGEEGVAKVKVCVNEQGRVQTAELDETSGVPRLDEAAVKVAKAYRLLPPTENGKAVSGCGSLPIRFRLTGG